MKKECAYISQGLRLEFSEGHNGNLLFRSRPCCHMHGNNLSNYNKQWIDCSSWRDIENHQNRRFFLHWQREKSELNPACFPCIEAEKINYNNSPRFLINKDYDYDYTILDVVVGNTCNLACPFCSPTVSSLIEKITSNMSKKDLPGKWGAYSEKNATPNKVAKVIAEFLSNRRIKQLKIIGGEPLLADNWQEIGKVIMNGSCKDMKLTFTTNGTVMNEEIIHQIKQVGECKITVSIDSIQNNYNFIRWPYSWNKVKDNMNFLLKNKPNNTWINVDGLISVINFEFLPEIIKEFSKWPSYSFMFDLKPLGSELDFKVLSKDIINDVYIKIYNKKIKANIEYFLDNYETLNLNYLKEKTKNSLNWFLLQRNMDKRSVLGLKTLQYLGI